jgi:hypothetical protein
MNARIPCAATQDLNRYLDQQERGEQRSEAIDERAAKLMATVGECCPTNAGNLKEALSEAAAAFWVKLAGLLDGDPAPVVACIKAESQGYWTKLAELQAECELDAERENAEIAAAESRNEDRRDYDRDFQD